MHARYASTSAADALAAALADVPPRALYALSVEDDGSACFTPALLAQVRALAAESHCGAEPPPPEFRGAWCLVGQRGTAAEFGCRPPLPAALQGARAALPAEGCPQFWVDLSVTGRVETPIVVPPAAAAGAAGGGVRGTASWPPRVPV